MAFGAAFTPFGTTGANSTVNLAVTGSSSSVTIQGVDGSSGPVLRIVNVGTNTVFIAWAGPGTAATASLTTSMPMLPNSVETFTLPTNTTQLSAIAATTGNTLYITRGEGL